MFTEWFHCQITHATSHFLENCIALVLRPILWYFQCDTWVNGVTKPCYCNLLCYFCTQFKKEKQGLAIEIDWNFGQAHVTTISHSLCRHANCVQRSFFSRYLNAIRLLSVGLTYRKVIRYVMSMSPTSVSLFFQRSAHSSVRRKKLIITLFLKGSFHMSSREKKNNTRHGVKY